jgi:hypothetical protein
MGEKKSDKCSKIHMVAYGGEWTAASQQQAAEGIAPGREPNENGQETGNGQKTGTA